MNVRFDGKRVLQVLFPLLLAVYPFIHTAQGLDIMDTTYAMTGYTWLSRMDEMWLLATWLPNLLGALIVHLPGGGTLAGMTVYCTVFQSGMALLVWFALGRVFPVNGAADAPNTAEEGFTSWLRFLLILIAESLCWCPAVILYNYLSWFFMTLLIVFLLLAFREEGGSGSRRYYFLAGCAAGINLFVRFPNIVEALLIIAVWFHALLSAKSERKDSAFIGKALRDTGICVLGYITGVIIPFVIISIRYGISAWPNMIASLFSMTSDASDYTAGGMIAAVFGAYMTTLEEMLPMLAVVAAGILLFAAVRKKTSFRNIAIFIYAFLLAFLFRIYYAKGVFTANYWYYDAVFELAMMAIVLSVLLDVLAVCGILGESRLMRTAAFLSLLQILLLPLGSNNYTFPVVNDLFLILPVTGMLFLRALRRLREASRGEDRRFLRAVAGSLHLPLLALGLLLMLLLAFQGFRFHLQYSFGDGTDGRTRDTAVTGIPRAAGTVTSAVRADSLETLYDRCEAVKRENGEERTAIIYGNAPGLHYLLDLPPALFTAWPDLNSNESARIGEALEELSASGEKPLVILRQEALSPPTGNSAVKADMILDYLEKMQYNELFRVDGEKDVTYIVYDRAAAFDE